MGTLPHQRYQTSTPKGGLQTKDLKYLTIQAIAVNNGKNLNIVVKTWKGGVMNASIRSMNGFPSGILCAYIITAFLFVTLPMLTRFQPPRTIRPDNESILIEKPKPSPPLPDDPEESTRQTLPPEKPLDTTIKPPRTQPLVNIPRGNPLVDMGNGIEIVIPTLNTDISPISGAFTPEEVDQQPRVLRSFPPQYPYRASRDNIQGWVVLRFVVDAEGMAEKIEVVSSDPAGIFEGAALKAVQRYRFKPAIKNGAAVKCVIKQRIRFSLD